MTAKLKFPKSKYTVNSHDFRISVQIDLCKDIR